MFKGFSYRQGPASYFNYEYDSLPESSKTLPRLLRVSNFLTLPVNLTRRFLVTSTDVIHSFAVPSLSIKVDAVPGRINQVFSIPLRCGLFFGQCSEICGSNHSFMPICIEVTSISNFDKNSLSLLLEEVLDCKGLAN